MNRDVDDVRREVLETLERVAKEKQPEYRRALCLFNEGYRAKTEEFDDDVFLPYQTWGIQFPNEKGFITWDMCLENMPQLMWEELDPTGELDVRKVFDLLEELGRNQLSSAGGLFVPRRFFIS